MGNCFGAQVRAEIPPGANDPGAASSSKKSRNSIVGTSTQEGGREASDANHGGLLCQPATPAMGGSLRAFSYNDLKAATRNFRPNCLLGKGGSGCVFKGYIDEQTFMPTQPGQGIPIAIKKLNLDRPQEHKEWLAKLHFLGTLHHPNLAKLLGSCAEVDHHRLLVYEFMPRGSLENHLFQKGNHHQTLSWVIRMKIAIDAARGLAFLHNAETPIIYKDLKSSNILLDSQFNAKLSAKLDVLLTKDGAACLSSRVIATGYGAPEYVAIGRLTVKSDVYSFGVVLLEILTGRRVVDGSRPDEEQNLVEWAGPFLSDKRKSLRIMDQKLKGQYSVEGAQKAARVVLHCVKEDAKKRPTMKQVVESLQHLLNAEELSTYNGCNDLNQDGQSLLEAPGHGVVHGVQRDELWQCIDGSSPTMAP